MPGFASLWHTPSGIGILGTLVAIATVAVGFACAVRPDERRLALMRPLSLATIFAALCTFSVGIATILTGIGNSGDLSASSWRAISRGAAETFVPIFAAFGCLTVAWVLVAIGIRKG